jgi:hypothetical protein
MNRQGFAAVAQIDDLHPRPVNLSCRFIARVHNGHVSRANIALAERLQVAVVTGETLSPVALEQVTMQFQSRAVWLVPGFAERLGFDFWCEQHGTIQMLQPEHFRYVVEQVVPPTCGQTGQTIVNDRFVANRWSRVPTQWYERDGPLKDVADPEHVRAQIDPESLLTGWIVATRTFDSANIILELKRQFPIGTAPDQWDDDWPAPFFPEADRLVIKVDRAHHVITKLIASYDDIVYAEYEYSDIDIEPGLEPQDFNPFVLGIS